MDNHYSKYLKYKKKYLNLKNNENYYGGQKPASKLPTRCLKDKEKVNKFRKPTKEEIAAAYVKCTHYNEGLWNLRDKMKSIKVSDAEALNYLLNEYVGPKGEKYTPGMFQGSAYVIEDADMLEWYVKNKYSVEKMKIDRLLFKFEALDLLNAGYSKTDIADVWYSAKEFNLYKKPTPVDIEDERTVEQRENLKRAKISRKDLSKAVKKKLKEETKKQKQIEISEREKFKNNPILANNHVRADGSTYAR